MSPISPARSAVEAVELRPGTNAAERSTPANDNNVTSYLVAFDRAFDAENPKDWSARQKWAVTNFLSITGFNRIMVSTIMAPALSTIASELHMNSVESVMALSIYLLAAALGPLLIGPLSEVYGRKPILHASNVWFLVWNILCGCTNTKGLLIAARFMAGFGASAIYALAGGVLGDVWLPEQRGRSLGVYLLVPVLGAAVGPIIGGFIAPRISWRWLFWSTSALQALMIVYSFLTFRETYAPLILRRRAEHLRRSTGNLEYHTLDERLNPGATLFSVLAKALSRPMRLLAFHPVIQLTSLISAFYYGVLYIVLATFADVWASRYGESIEISGLHYIAIAAGEVLGTQIGGPLMDFLFRRVKAQARQHRHEHSVGVEGEGGGEGEPKAESRIPLIFPGALVAPLGLFLYGWGAQYKVPWIAVDVGVLLTCFGMQVAGMPLQAYVIDAYPDYTSSALAASQFLRSLTAFLFPLFTPKFYSELGYGWGNSAIGFIALVFGVPAPLLIWMFGAGLRARARSAH